jgi:hypothetical protein
MAVCVTEVKLKLIGEAGVTAGGVNVSFVFEAGSVESENEGVLLKLVVLATCCAKSSDAVGTADITGPLIPTV